MIDRLKTTISNIKALWMEHTTSAIFMGLVMIAQARGIDLNGIKDVIEHCYTLLANDGLTQVTALVMTAKAVREHMTEAYSKVRKDES